MKFIEKERTSRNISKAKLIKTVISSSFLNIFGMFFFVREIILVTLYFLATTKIISQTKKNIPKIFEE